jgi:hypothetical protein
VRVTFVGQQKHVPPAAQLGDALEFGVVQNGAARIVRGIHNNYSCPRRERALDEVGCEAESVFFFCGHEYRIRIHEARDVSEGDPVWRGNDDIVAFLDNSGEDIEQGMLAAEVDDALRNVVCRTEVSRVLVDNRLLQFLDSADRRVLGKVLTYGPYGRLFDVFRRRKIRLAGAEVDDVDALVPQSNGGLHDSHCFRY